MQVWMNDGNFEFRWIAADARSGLGTSGWSFTLNKIGASGDVSISSSISGATFSEIGGGVYGLSLPQAALASAMGSDEFFYGQINNSTTQEITFIPKHSVITDDASGVSAKIGTSGDSSSVASVFGKIAAVQGAIGGSISSDIAALQSALISDHDTSVTEIIADNATKAGTITTAIGALNNLSAAQARTQADDALAAYDAPTKSEMDSAFSAAGSASSSGFAGLQSAIGGLNNVSTSEVRAQADAALAAYDAPTKGEMDSAFAAIETVVDRIEVDLTEIGAASDSSSTASLFGKMERLYQAVDQIEGFTDDVETNQGNMATALAAMETKAQADTRQAALIVEHDATQAALVNAQAKLDSNESKLVAAQSSLDDLETKAQADARQSALVSGVGALETKAQADTRQAALVAEHDASQVILGTLETKSQADTAHSDAAGDRNTKAAAVASAMGTAASDRSTKSGAAQTDRDSKKSSLDTQLAAIKSVVDTLDAVNQSASLKEEAPVTFTAAQSGDVYQEIFFTARQQDGVPEELTALDTGHSDGGCGLFVKVSLNGADMNARLYEPNSGGGSYVALDTGTAGVKLDPTGSASPFDAGDYKRAVHVAGGVYCVVMKVQAGDNGMLSIQAAGWDADPSPDINQAVLLNCFREVKSYAQAFGKRGFAL
jgi:hypothetical protein